ncbi:1-acyl-sn-glycerol-3-phosphate acyltransferase [Pseudogracilibacillus auburnensis]|uniref:1-acyl-sn-glycerol-3-phosphate acyltransferase n=1 Tax=Pseudogracilibacillus auburnensis TaxID=1494959 RepID=A0A2V3VXQ7_9BACI|nr:lysophospholipid acyltransferase family protein [Pseudogracilibacillus auburnensis]MBO1004049.1 1-acyl-sn-glycerol-3-phosphate acyltransferase [Pseudogracilibacillus auburnensis]PXW85661.1 1-acyl-sn-glycerol-3-phosphate acyltransferase [Pseudogracilibacillus auburnensis]
MIYYIAAYLLKFFLSLFGFLKVYEKENLPSSDGYVIACTHTGWVDILWLGVSILPTKVHYMAKKELFESRFLNWLMNHLNAFPVDRENPGPSSIKTPMRLIKDGEIVGIFPSGTRTSEDVPLKRGAVTIASYAKAPIVPAAYVGPNNFKELFKFKRPKIVFGKPIQLRKDLSKKEALEVMMTELNDALKELQQTIK